MHNLSHKVFTAVLVLCLAQAAYYYPLLPDRVASHFGASGKPDAWSDKNTFMTIYLGAVAFSAALFALIGPVLRRTPDSLINLPHKHYWLAPERRAETMDLLSRRFLWFASATLLLLFDIFHQTFQVHLGRAQALDHPVASVAVYCTVSLLWTIGLIVTFRRPDDERS